MGAKLGKNKTVSISEKTNGQKNKEVITTSKNHFNETTKLEKNIKKNKEKILNKKSLDTKVDKCTSTDGGVISSSSSSSYIKQLAGGSGYNNLPYDPLNTQINSINQSETPSKDVLELRNACIRRGIISPETNTITLQTSNEQDYGTYIANTVEKSTNETSTTVVTNNEQVQNQRQQQQIES